jgi:hypothetical protein
MQLLLFSFTRQEDAAFVFIFSVSFIYLSIYTKFHHEINDDLRGENEIKQSFKYFITLWYQRLCLCKYSISLTENKLLPLSAILYMVLLWANGNAII